MKLTVVVLVVMGICAAQDRPGPRRVQPILAALDADHDGVITAAEIDNAPAALKTLDKKGDGTLTADEVRPNFGGEGGAPGAGGNDRLIQSLMQFDKNADGKLTKDEVPERMQGMFARRRQ